MQYTEGKEEINIIAVDPVSTDMVPGNTHKRRLLDVIDGSKRVKTLYEYMILHSTSYIPILTSVCVKEIIPEHIFSIYIHSK